MLFILDTFCFQELRAIHAAKASVLNSTYIYIVKLICLWYVQAARYLCVEILFNIHTFCAGLIYLYSTEQSSHIDRHLFIVYLFVCDQHGAHI